MTLDEAVAKLKGPKGTQVHITIVRTRRWTSRSN